MSHAERHVRVTHVTARKVAVIVVAGFTILTTSSASEPVGAAPASETRHAQDALLSQRVADTDVTQFLKKKTTDPKFVKYRTDSNCYRSNVGLYFVCPGKKTEFAYDQDSRIYTVWMKRGYKGKLPNGISFSDSRNKLIDRLGKPSRVNGTYSMTWNLKNSVRLVVDFPLLPGPGIPDRITQVSLQAK